MSKNKRKYVAPTYERNTRYSSPTYEKGPYAKMSEFRYNNSRAGGGHPNYIFGWKNDRYLSLGITDQPNVNYEYHQLRRSPNPKPKSKAPNFLRTDKMYNDKTELYSKKTLENWSFDKDDKKVVNSVVKKHTKKMQYANSNNNSSGSNRKQKRKSK